MQIQTGLARILVGLALAFLPLRAPVAQSRAGDSFRVVNVRMFDGARVVERAQVAVVGGTIRAVGTDLREWRDLPVIDGAGATLLPGLIDAHVHVRDADDLRQSLRFGVTTVLDMGAVIEPQVLFALRETAKTAPDLADIRLAGFFANARGTDEPRDPRISVDIPPVNNVDEAKRFVASRHAEGVDYLKIGLRGVRSATLGVPNLDTATAAALVETAHANGMLAVAHIETLDDVRLALRAGIDGLAHVWRRGGANPEVASQVAKQGVFVSATLDVSDGFAGGRSSLLADPRFGNVLSPSIREHLSRPFAVPAGNQPDLEASLAGVRSLHRAGARLLVGTDSNRDVPAVFGISVHRELELLVRAGLAPTEALAAGTSHAAEAFRLRDRGRIATGLRADLLLVRGDPTSDVLATRDILRVWKSGMSIDLRAPER